jgi:hypothetical protein
MKAQKIIVSLMALFVLIPAGFTQDIDALVSNILRKNGPGYMQAACRCYGSLFNTGFTTTQSYKSLDSRPRPGS